MQQNSLGNLQNDSSFQMEKRTYRKWNLSDNEKYITFLKNNIELFRNESTRRKYKVFQLMHKSIGNKNTSQCKSHHQKMNDKYGTVENIIQNLERKISNKPCLDEPIASTKISEEISLRQDSGLLSDYLEEVFGKGFFGYENPEKKDEDSTFNVLINFQKEDK